jgi:hypothetical protein
MVPQYTMEEGACGGGAYAPHVSCKAKGEERAGFSIALSRTHLPSDLTSFHHQLGTNFQYMGFGVHFRSKPQWSSLIEFLSLWLGWWEGSV